MNMFDLPQPYHIRILTHDGRDITDPVWPMYDLMHLYNARQAAAINLRNEGESKGTVEYIDDNGAVVKKMKVRVKDFFN